MTVDLKTLKTRHIFLRSLREFFDTQGFLELETPYLLIANTPDPHIDPIFARVNHPVKQARQLHTSPEIWLKKALGLGAPQIYQIAKVFRDDPPGPAHSKEFTMVEWYRTNADLASLLQDCQKIFELAQAAQQPGPDSAGISFSFVQKTASELFEQHASIDLPAVLYEISLGNYLYLNNLLALRGDHLPEGSNFIDAFFLVMIKYIEPNLPLETPIVISRWPVQLAALAASCLDDPLFCDRFEIYYRGLEIANAYQECLDPEVLTKRFDQENIERKRLGKQPFTIDLNFVRAMIGLPKTAGIALGIDRLLMAVLQKKHLKNLIWGYQDQ